MAASEQAVAAARGRPARSRRSILADAVIQYGPRDVLSRTLLRADTELRRHGVSVSFASFEELVDVNRRHPESWRPILPLFDPEIGGIDGSNGFAVLGYDGAGEPVYAHACRLYDLAGRSLKDEIESLRVFYADPDRSKGDGEALVATAASAARVTVPAVFIGAVWYRPDYRKKDLMRSTSPMVRALAYTRWQSDFAFSFMAEDLVRAGTAEKAHFPHVDWEISMVRTPVLRAGVLRAALVWTNAAEQLDHLRAYLASRADPEVDAIVEKRSA